MKKISYSSILQYPKKEESLVFFTVRCNGNTAKVSTRQTVKTKMWNKQLHRCITYEKFTDREKREVRKVNKQLDKIEAFIIDRLSGWGEQSRYLTDPKEFKDIVAHYSDMFFRGIEEEEKKQNQKATEWMLDNINSDRVDPHTGRFVADRTKRTQTTIIHRLQSFLADCHLSDSFTTFSEADFGSKFMKWGYKNRNYTPNTIGNTFEILKAQMNAAKRSGFEFEDTFYKQLPSKSNHEVDNIYLNEDEIKAIYDLNIPKLKQEGLIDEKRRMEETRDLFIIGCYTGLRRSDLNKLNDGIWNLDKDKNSVSIVAEKTKKRVVIPLHPFVRAIYYKYNGHLPKLGDKHNTNVHLKNLARLADINEIVSKRDNRGGKVKTLKHLKYELVSFHTARRSFATNMFLKGIPCRVIMQLTGHTNEQTFLKYIKATPEQIAKLLVFSSVA